MELFLYVQTVLVTNFERCVYDVVPEYVQSNYELEQKVEFLDEALMLRTAKTKFGFCFRLNWLIQSSNAQNDRSIDVKERDSAETSHPRFTENWNGVQ
jgi:hypothetical protein